MGETLDRIREFYSSTAGRIVTVSVAVAILFFAVWHFAARDEHADMVKVIDARGRAVTYYCPNCRQGFDARVKVDEKPPFVCEKCKQRTGVAAFHCFKCKQIIASPPTIFNCPKCGYQYDNRPASQRQGAAPNEPTR
jgi:predicted RNA-binding Zn-ribbon protein involved in translation (DUF1610 family)